MPTAVQYRQWSMWGRVREIRRMWEVLHMMPLAINISLPWRTPNRRSHSHRIRAAGRGKWRTIALNGRYWCHHSLKWVTSAINRLKEWRKWAQIVVQASVRMSKVFLIVLWTLLLLLVLLPVVAIESALVLIVLTVALVAVVAKLLQGVEVRVIAAAAAAAAKVWMPVNPQTKEVWTATITLRASRRWIKWDQTKPPSPPKGPAWCYKQLYSQL